MWTAVMKGRTYDKHYHLSRRTKGLNLFGGLTSLIQGCSRRKLSTSWCAAVNDQTNVSLNVAVLAHVNKMEREIASKDVVGD